MWLDSITQTLSNPDCGLSKPHIPDNTPYISHRLMRSNRQGPHPQIYRMTSLFFSHTVATICLLYIHRTVLFPLSFVSVTSTASSSSLLSRSLFYPLSISVPLTHCSAVFTSPVYTACSVLYTKRKKINVCKWSNLMQSVSNMSRAAHKDYFLLINWIKLILN